MGFSDAIIFYHIPMSLSVYKIAVFGIVKIGIWLIC